MKGRIIKAVTLMAACIGIAVSGLGLIDVLELRVIHNRLMKPEQFREAVLTHPTPLEGDARGASALEPYVALRSISDRATMQSTRYLTCIILFALIVVGVVLSLVLQRP